MDRVIDFFSQNLTSGDSFLSLLIFLLFVFGSLYILFQLLFKLGDCSGKKKEQKKEGKKEEKKEPVKNEENEEKHSKVVEKKEKHRKIRNLKEDEMVFLQEDEPYVETRPYYTHELKDSYIVGKYDGELNRYSFGDNYLHEYFNDEKFKRIPEPLKTDDIKFVEEKENKLQSRGDEIISAYKDLPTELKQYIINKLLRE